MAVIPSTDVNLATEVRDVLSGAGGSVSNDVTSFFKSEAKINKWARYKPTKYYGLDFTNGEEEPKQWQAGNGLCGFTEGSVVFNSNTALISAYKNGTTFVYELPTGGASYPYRIGDFRNYKTDAVSPVWSFEYTGQMASNNPSSSSTFTILGNSSIDSNYNLRMSDILPDGVNSLSSYYFGVIITNASGTVVATKTAPSSIDTSTGFSRSVTFTQTEVGVAGKYFAYPAFINATGRTFVAVPIEFIEFQILTSVDANKLGWMAGTGTWSLSGAQFTYSGQLGYSKDFEGVNVFIELQINGVNSGHSETVTLARDSVSSDGNTYYMNYSRTIRGISNNGDSFRLRCGYGNNYGNNAYLDLKEE